MGSHELEIHNNLARAARLARITKEAAAQAAAVTHALESPVDLTDDLVSGASDSNAE